MVGILYIYFVWGQEKSSYFYVQEFVRLALRSFQMDPTRYFSICFYTTRILIVCVCIQNQRIV